MECEFCKKILNSKSALNVHQKNTKYCLKLQGNSQKGQFVCECGKDFHNKHHLISHQDVCRIVNTVYVQELRNRVNTAEQENIILSSKLSDAFNTIKDLQDMIEKITLQAINRPTHQTKNKQIINLAPFDLTQDKAKIIFANKYTPEYFLQGGMKGLARFVSDHIVKTDTGESIYACYDRSRDVFKYKNEAGEYINDIKAVRLVEIIHPAAAEHSRAMNDKFHEEYMSALSEYDEENITNKITQNELDCKEMKATQSRESNFLHKYLNTELDSFSKELGNNIK
jgi:hypothetical protein